MPTPRFTPQVARQAGQSAPIGSNQKDWLPALVLVAPTGIGGVYQVSVQGGAIVKATSAIDAAVTEGSLVYVVRSGTQFLIVAVQ